MVQVIPGSQVSFTDIAQPLLVVDGFMPNAGDIRARALSAGFQTERFQNRDYTGTGVKYKPFEVLDRMNRYFGQYTVPELFCFRLSHTATEMDAAVHSDNTVGKFAAMLYLTPDDVSRGQVSGTAFWKHKATGWLAMPTEAELAAAGMTIEDMMRDWKDMGAWEMVGLVPIRFNRFISYESRTFHSRWPHAGFGSADDPASARLTLNLFYNFA